MFELMSLAGAITVGICYAKSDEYSVWNSWLGLITICSLVVLTVGLFGWVRGV